MSPYSFGSMIESQCRRIHLFRSFFHCFRSQRRNVVPCASIVIVSLFPIVIMALVAASARVRKVPGNLTSSWMTNRKMGTKILGPEDYSMEFKHRYHILCRAFNAGKFYTNPSSDDEWTYCVAYELWMMLSWDSLQPKQKKRLTAIKDLLDDFVKDPAHLRYSANCPYRCWYTHTFTN